MSDVLITAANLATLKLTAGTRFDKYGVVSVRNIDGTPNREYRITEAELAAFKASPNGIPPGVTTEEWTSGRVKLYGKGMDVGDVVVKSDGTLKMKITESVVGPRIVENYVFFTSAEWTGTVPNVTVTSDKLALIAGTPLQSVVDGSVELK